METLFWHLDAISDCYIAGNIDVLSKGAVFTDHCTTLDMTKMPDLCVFSDGYIIIHIAALMYKIV